MRTGDARAAVIHAVDRTASVIGTAGAIMTAVFLGFATEPDAVVKMLGLGLAPAVSHPEGRSGRPALERPSETAQ